MSKTTKSEPNVYTEFPEAMSKAQAWATVPTPAPRNRKKDEEVQFKDQELHLEIQVGFSYILTPNTPLLIHTSFTYSK